MLYKEKNEIIDWLEAYEVENYMLRPDETYGYVVDVAGDVDLRNKNLIQIPVKFGKVTGNFHCGDNQLTSLEEAPQIVGKGFYCQGNKLTSLEGSPQTIGKGFCCDNNQLTSLKGGPQHVGRNFLCNDNKLTSLEGAPDSVGGSFSCDNNQLTSLEGIPQIVGGYFYCWNNQELGELQDMTNLKAIQAYLLSQKIAMKLSQDLDNPYHSHKKDRKVKL